MKFLPLTLLLSLGLTGCKEDSDTPTGLVGEWQLTSRQCFCAPGPVPNETATFTATEFSFYRDGQLISHGLYAPDTGEICSAAKVPVTKLSFAPAAPGSAFTNVQITVSYNTLTLDYGSPCDAPRDTYRRRP